MVREEVTKTYRQGKAVNERGLYRENKSGSDESSAKTEKQFKNVNRYKEARERETEREGKRVEQMG